MNTALVLGGAGFIGHHMVRRLKAEGFWVRAVDLKYPAFSPSEADDFILGDLRDPDVCAEVVDRQFKEIFQFAADMGGAGYIFTGENDAAIMQNSALINLNILNACKRRNAKIFFIHHQRAFIQWKTRKILIIQFAKSRQPIRPILTLIMDGKNYSVNGYILRTQKMRGSGFALAAIIIFLGQKAFGKAGVKRLLRQCAESCGCNK